MPKQLFLSPILGDGSIDNSYRPALADTVAAINATRPGAPTSPPIAGIYSPIPTDPVTGRPIRNWCLCVVAAKDLRPFKGVADVHGLPDVPKDMKVSAVHRGSLQALVNKMDRLGIDNSFLLNPDGSVKADGWREVIRGIGRAAGDQSFHEDAFDYADIS